MDRGEAAGGGGGGGAAGATAAAVLVSAVMVDVVEVVVAVVAVVVVVVVVVEVSSVIESGRPEVLLILPVGTTGTRWGASSILIAQCRYCRGTAKHIQTFRMDETKKLTVGGNDLPDL